MVNPLEPSPVATKKFGLISPKSGRRSDVIDLAAIHEPNFFNSTFLKYLVKCGLIEPKLPQKLWLSMDNKITCPSKLVMLTSMA